MTMTYFLHIDGIHGDSLDRAHPKWHEVSDFSWGVTQSATPTGGGGGAGRPTLQPLIFSTPFTAALPLLFDACVTGRTIPKAVLEAANDSARAPVTYLKIELEDVRVSSLSLAGSDGGLPAESFALTYRHIGITAYTVDAAGRSPPEPASDSDDTRTSSSSIFR